MYLFEENKENDFFHFLNFFSEFSGVPIDDFSISVDDNYFNFLFFDQETSISILETPEYNYGESFIKFYKKIINSNKIYFGVLISFSNLVIISEFCVSTQKKTLFSNYNIMFSSGNVFEENYDLLNLNLLILKKYKNILNIEELLELKKQIIFSQKVFYDFKQMISNSQNYKLKKIFLKESLNDIFKFDFSSRIIL